MATQFTVTGTTGNDNLQSPGSVPSLVRGLQGNDTLTLIAPYDEVEAGSGTDLIRLTGALLSNGVNAGSGADTVNLDGNNVNGLNVSLDDDNDFLQKSVAAGNINSSTLQGGKGNDTIDLNTTTFASTFVAAGAGADLLSLSATTISTGTVNGGSGADTIVLGSAIATTQINGQKGADSVSALGMSGASLFAGAGHDTITVQSAVAARINLGAGNDVATVAGGSTLVGGGGGDTVVLGDNAIGNYWLDQINITTAGTGTEAQADGADRLTGGSLSGAISVYGAGGNDTIQFGTINTGGTIVLDGGNNNDFIVVGTNTGSNITINGGGGADTIQFGNMTAQAAMLLDAGAGADLVTGGSVWGTVNGGAGLDTISVLGVLSATSVDGGSEADLITVASGGYLLAASTIAGGAGADTINVVGTAGVATGRLISLGAGNDLISFGGAALDSLSAASTQYTSILTINGGTGADTISLSGTLTNGLGGFLEAGVDASAGLLESRFGTVYEAGDTIVMTGFNVAGTANWRGAGGQVWIVSGGELELSAALESAAGSVAVWQHGNDTTFFVSVADSTVVAFTVLGKDLVAATTTGLTNNTTSNFLFSIATTGTNAGISITLN